MITPYGNVDTEAGGTGQPFEAPPQSGNVQSDTAPANNAIVFPQQQSQADPMQYYYQLGQQLLQQQQSMQRAQMQQMQPPGGTAPPMDNFDLGAPGMLTAGFDPNWLSIRLNAGSANGASITSSGGTKGAGTIPTDSDTRNLPVGGAGWDTPTTPSYGGLKGAGRLM